MLSLYGVGDRWMDVCENSVEEVHKGKTEEKLPEWHFVYHNLNGLTWVWIQSSASRDATRCYRNIIMLNTQPTLQ